jgi:uncharacterized protein
MTKLLASAACAAFLLVGAAQAQTPAPNLAPAPGPTAPATAVSEGQLRIARELVELTGIGRSFDAAFPDIALRIRQTFAPTRPELVKDMDDTLIALIPEIRTRRGELVERSARSLGSQFSEAELRQLQTFFISDIGKKYINAQPQLLQDVFAAMEPWMQSTSEFFFNRFREEMRKKGHTL